MGDENTRSQDSRISVFILIKSNRGSILWTETNWKTGVPDTKISVLINSHVVRDLYGQKPTANKPRTGNKRPSNKSRNSRTLQCIHGLGRSRAGVTI